MQGRLENAEEGVHLAMCDNIDTRRVLETLRELVVASNAYIEKTRVGEPGVNRYDPFNSFDISITYPHRSSILYPHSSSPYTL